MRYIATLDHDGSIQEEGFGPDDSDFASIFGRPPGEEDRWLEGEGADAEEARDCAMQWSDVHTVFGPETLSSSEEETLDEDEW